MSDKEELSKMPVWQNHEQRITALEIIMNGLSEKVDNVNRTIREGNIEQKKKLDKIDQHLMEEFFHKKRVTHENKWLLYGKVTGGLVAGGSLIYLVIEKIIGG